MDKKVIRVPLTNEVIKTLHAGEKVYISGVIFTARDKKKKKMLNLLAQGDSLPFDIEGQIIYYAGPSPARPGSVIGACGPTTSYRMDDLTEPLLKLGLKGMIGKGNRNATVIQGIQEYQAVYFAAIGGAGALIASCIKKSEIIAFDDLGPEALRRLEVVEMPVIVVIDSYGNNLYVSEPNKYKVDEIK